MTVTTDRTDAGLLGGRPNSANVFVAREGVPRPPEGLGVDDERLLRKQELAAAFRLFGKFGFSEGVAGHMTARDPELTDHFWVNPFGMNFQQVRVSDLILVDHSGHVVQGKGTVNLAGFYIHSEVHKARPDVISAAHTHSVYGRALASLGAQILPLNQDATAFYEDHALYGSYGGPAGYQGEGRRIAQALGDKKAAVLQHHGLLTTGHSVGEAAWWFIAMERTAQVQLLAMAAGRPLEMDHSIAKLSYNELGTHYAGWLSFRPLWDEITAEQPGLLA